MKTIQAKGGRLVVLDTPSSGGGSPTELLSWPLLLAPEVTNYTTMNLHGLSPADEKSLLVAGMEYIKGIFMHSTGVIILKEGSAEVARGSDIHLTNISLSDAKVSVLGETFRYGEIESVDDETIVIKDLVFENSILVSTEVHQPFPQINNYNFQFSVGNTIITITPDIIADDSEVGITGDEVCAEINAGVLALVGRQVITMTYDTDTSKFTIKALDKGTKTLSMEGDSRIMLGFDSPDYTAGTKAIAGMLVEVIDGTAEGETASIISHSNGDIVLDSAISGLAAGDHVRIVDVLSDVTVDVSILMYE